MSTKYRLRGQGTPATLGFAGDVSLGGLIDQSLPNSLPDPKAISDARKARKQHPLLQRGMRTAEVWGDCVGDLQASVTALSLISPLTMHGQRSQRGRSTGHTSAEAQRAHPLQIETLIDANIDFVSLANGHSMDFHEEGLLDTWGALRTARIAHAGTGASREAAYKPAIKEAFGRKVAYLSISAAGCGLTDASGVELWAASESRLGIAHFDLWDTRMHEEALRELRDAVRVAKEQGRVNYVVVSVCWGSTGPGDGTRNPMGMRHGEIPHAMRVFARGLVDIAGANIIHGHGTRHMLGVEVYKGVPILYSCGVLLSDRLQSCKDVPTRVSDDPSLKAPPRPELRPDISYIARVVIRPTNQVGWVELRPVHCRMLQCNLAKGRHKQWAVETLQQLCNDLNTPCEVSRLGLRVPISTKPPQEERPKRRIPKEQLQAELKNLENESGNSSGRPSKWWSKLDEDGEDSLFSTSGRFTKAWRWLASSVFGSTQEPKMPPMNYEPRQPTSTTNRIEPVNGASDEEAPGPMPDLTRPSALESPLPSPLRGGRPSPGRGRLSSPGRGPGVNSPGASRWSPGRGRWSPGRGIWSPCKPSSGSGPRWEAVPCGLGGMGAGGSSASAEQLLDNTCIYDDAESSVGGSELPTPIQRHRGSRLADPASSSGAAGHGEVHLTINDDLEEEAMQDARDSPLRQQRSPGVRRTGRLGSNPSSPRKGSSNLWGWAEGGAEKGGLLEEDEEEEEDINSLLGRLGGGR